MTAEESSALAFSEPSNLNADKEEFLASVASASSTKQAFTGAKKLDPNEEYSLPNEHPGLQRVRLKLTGLLSSHRATVPQSFMPFVPIIMALYAVKEKPRETTMFNLCRRFGRDRSPRKTTRNCAATSRHVPCDEPAGLSGKPHISAETRYHRVR